MKLKNKALVFLLGCIFFIYPFGQITKFAINSEVKVSFLDILVSLFTFLAFVFIKNAKKKPFIRKSLVLFIIAAIISLLVNLNLAPPEKVVTGIFYLLRFIIYTLFYLQLFQFVTSDKAKYSKFLDKGLLLSGFFTAVFGLLQYFLYPDLRNLIYLGWDPHYYRLFGTFFDPNFTGIILVLTLFQLIFLKKRSFINYLMFCLIAVAIFLTRSRSALLSLLTGITVLGVLDKSLRKLILGLIIIFILVSLLPKPLVDVFDLLRVTSSVARVENWKQSVEIALKSPIFGNGFGVIRFSDAGFLYVLAGTGILGLLAYLNLWKKIIEFGIKKREVLVISSVLFVGSWFNNILFYPWIFLWFYLFLVRYEA